MDENFDDVYRRGCAQFCSEVDMMHRKVLEVARYAQDLVESVMHIDDTSSSEIDFEAAMFGLACAVAADGIRRLYEKYTSLIESVLFKKEAVVVGAPVGAPSADGGSAVVGNAPAPPESTIDENTIVDQPLFLMGLLVQAAAKMRKAGIQ